LLAAVIVLRLLSSQRVSSHSCEALPELVPDPVVYKPSRSFPIIIVLVPSLLIIVTCLLDKCIGINDGINTKDKLSVLRRTVSPGTNHVATLFFDCSPVNTSSGMTGCLRGLQTTKNETTTEKIAPVCLVQATALVCTGSQLPKEFKFEFQTL